MRAAFPWRIEIDARVQLWMDMDAKPPTLVLMARVGGDGASGEYRFQAKAPDGPTPAAVYGLVRQLERRVRDDTQSGERHWRWLLPLLDSLRASWLNWPGL